MRVPNGHRARPLTRRRPRTRIGALISRPTRRRALWSLAALAILLLPATPAAGASLSVSCTRVGVEGYVVEAPEDQAGAPAVDTGLFRLACPVIELDCDPGAADPCSAAGGAVSVVGGAFCWRPLGPLPPAMSEPCAAILNGGGAVMDSTGCSRPTAVGDERWAPGGLAIVRPGPDQVRVYGSAGCGERSITCWARATWADTPALHWCL